MRGIVFLLILGNMLFFSWTQGYLGLTESPDAQRMQQQLHADQLRIVSRGEPPPLENKPADKPKKEELTCLQWLKLAPPDADRLERFLAEKFPEFKTTRSTLPGNTSYWVFIPPQSNKQEAEKKAVELKRLNVPEFFIVQDAGPHRLAISLGIFSSEEAAQARLETLRAKGVKSARIGERGGEPARATLETNGAAAQKDALMQAVAGFLAEPAAAPCSAARP